MLRVLSAWAAILVPVVALAQFPWESGFDFSGGAFGARRKPSWYAPFKQQTCLTSGTVLSPGPTTLTVSRADAQWVDRVNANQRTPGLIDEDAGTVAHVYWNGSALIDTKGNAWTQNGTVPQNPATWNAPPSAGVFSAANNYVAGTNSLMEFSGGWSTTVVVTVLNVSVSNSLVGKMNAAANTGWVLQYISATGLMRLHLHDGVLQTINSGSAALLGTANVVTVGKSGGTCYVKLNGAASASGACGTMTPATVAATIGVQDTSSAPATISQIHEVYATTTPFNEATVAALQASVMSKINQPILDDCPANTLAVSPQGAEVWAARTNYALQSSTSCVANAVQAPWVVNAVASCASDVALAPDGTVSMDEWTSTSNVGHTFQQATIASSATFTESVWMAKASGTGRVGIKATCTAGTANTCTCGTSDGSACTATPSTTDCVADFTAIGTTPVRAWVVTTCAAALTNPYIALIPNQYNISTGTTRFWGAQVEVGTYPGPYIPTTTTSVARAATVASVPLPDLHTTDTWCIGATVNPRHNWNDSITNVIWSSYAGALANAIDFYKTGSNYVFSVYDNAGVQRKVDVAHGLGAVLTSKRLVACNAAGTLALYVDGVSVGAPAGAGSGLQSATLTPLYIGSTSSSSQNDGAITSARVYPNATYRAGL